MAILTAARELGKLLNAAPLFLKSEDIVQDAWGGGAMLPFVEFALELRASRNAKHSMDDLKRDWKDRQQKQWILHGYSIFTFYTSQCSRQRHRRRHPKASDTTRPSSDG